MSTVPACSPKTNVVRLVEASGRPFRLHSYPADGPHLDAPAVAAALGIESDRVFKTLVARDDAGRVQVCILPGSLELDLRKAARAMSMRKLELIPLAELTPLTGYVRGGCSPLGMRKAYPTWLDETCGLFGTILVSAGQRGLQIELAPDDLLALCLQGGCPGARCADISHAV